MRRGVLDSASNGVDTVRHLLGWMERVRMVVVIERCGSKLSVPMLVLGMGTLKFCGRWDIVCGKGCSAVGAKRTPQLLTSSTRRQFDTSMSPRLVPDHSAGALRISHIFQATFRNAPHLLAHNSPFRPRMFAQHSRCTHQRELSALKWI